MKKALKYIIILAVSAVLTLLYGYTVGGEYTVWLAFAVFAVSTIISAFFDRKPSNERLLWRIIEVVATAGIVIMLSFHFYGEFNAIASSTVIERFEAKALYGDTRRVDTCRVWFITPEGNEELAVNYDFGFTDEELEVFPYHGGRVIIEECEGAFGAKFYRYVGSAE